MESKMIELNSYELNSSQFGFDMHNTLNDFKMTQDNGLQYLYKINIFEISFHHI